MIQLEEAILLDCDIEETNSQIADMEQVIQGSRCHCKDAINTISQLKRKLQSLLASKYDFELINGVPSYDTNKQ